MPECCIEDAFVAGLRALDCTPIPGDNHYSFLRRKDDCFPYAVVTTSIVTGLRTSDGTEKIQQVKLSGYFSVDKISDCNKFRALVEDWVFGKTCIALGDCGCFCVRSVVPGQMLIANNAVQFSVTLTGKYSAAVPVA